MDHQLSLFLLFFCPSLSFPRVCWAKSSSLFSKCLLLCAFSSGFTGFCFLSFFFLISLISYLLLFLKSDRSLVLNCCSDLTPTQAIKWGEATVGIWTTSGSMGRQISFHIFYPLLFVCFSFTVYLQLPIIYDFIFHIFISVILLLLSCSVFYPLSVCLSVSVPLPPHSLDWLEWVKQANLFSQGLKLPACLFGCGEAQMISALPSVTTAHVVQIKSKSALFV